MTVSVIIIAISSILFLYWFRYTCVLILSARTAKDYTREVAEANNLVILDVQREISEAGRGDLDRLHQALQRDYDRVQDLLSLGRSFGLEGVSLEQVILRADFAGMKFLYGMASRLHESTARSALAEMSQVVAYMANAAGERNQAAIQG